MHKKFLVPALAILLLPPAICYSQQSPSPVPEKSPAKAVSDVVDYSSLPPSEIVDKLQAQIIIWQDEIISGMESQIILPNIYKEMALAAVDSGTGKVKDQKMLDLLSKYGIGLSTKDGKKLNTPSDDAGKSTEPPEVVPFIEVKDNATREEKARIRELREKGLGLVDRATQSKKLTERLQMVAMDLLALGKTDDKAQALVEKYRIRQQGASAVASPSPSAARLTP